MAGSNRAEFHHLEANTVPEACALHRLSQERTA